MAAQAAQQEHETLLVHPEFSKMALRASIAGEVL